LPLRDRFSGLVYFVFMATNMEDRLGYYYGSGSGLGEVAYRIAFSEEAAL
jgi:hypothetical protein